MYWCRVTILCWLCFIIIMSSSSKIKQADIWIRRQWKRSIPLALKDVERENRKRGWGLSRQDLSRLLNRYRAYHTRTTRKRHFNHYFTTLYPRLGYVQVDLAFFQQSLKGYNDGCIGFFMGVDSLTSKLYCYPTRKKNTEAWKKALDLLMGEGRNTVRKLVTDQDSVVTTRSFQGYLEKEYSVSWDYLDKRDKAYLAERYIQWMKRHLSIQLNMSSRRRWIDFITPIVSYHNNQPAFGTRFTPNQVTYENEDLFRKERYRSDESPPAPLSSRIVRHFGDSGDKDIFLFRIGDKVRVHRRAHPYLKERVSGMSKLSVRGYYPEPYFIVRDRVLLYNINDHIYIPAYYLQRSRSDDSDAAAAAVKGAFYEQDLKKVEPQEITRVD